MANEIILNASNELLLSGASNLIVFSASTEVTYNLTGGTYFVSTDEDTETFTNDGATQVQIMVLPSDADDGFYINATNYSDETPIVITYESGQTIDTTNSKNYLLTSGDTTNVYLSGGTCYFSTGETVYNLWEDYSSTQVDSDGTGVRNTAHISLNGKHAVVGNTGGINYSSNYLSTFTQRLTGDGTQSCCLSKDGKYFYSCSLSFGTYRIRKSTDGGVNNSNILSNVQLVYMNCSYDGKYTYGLTTGGTMYFSDDYGTSYDATITGLTNVEGVCCSASGKYVYLSFTNNSVAVKRSSDYGETFEDVYSSNDAYYGISCDASGKYVALSLANSSTAQQRWSEDYGENWNTTSLADTNQQFYCSYVNPSGKFTYWGGDGDTYVMAYSTDYFNTISTILKADYTELRQSYSMMNSADQKYGVITGGIARSRKVSV